MKRVSVNQVFRKVDSSVTGWWRIPLPIEIASAHSEGGHASPYLRGLRVEPRPPSGEESK